MSKLRLKFNKTENMIYISHLDMMRVIQRAMKRAGIKVNYSQGFNPHAQLSFSTAVPLGLIINNEYMDVSLADTISAKTFIDRINVCLPKGLQMEDGIEISTTEKAIMNQIRWGSYLIFIDTQNSEKLEKGITDFLQRENIVYLKEKKKNRKWIRKEIDIRPLIESIDFFVREDDFVILKCMIRTGSEGNVKPELMMKLMNELQELELTLEDIKYQRTDLFIEKNNQKIKPI